MIMSVRRILSKREIKKYGMVKRDPELKPL